jgi:putative endonuclease
VKGRFTQIAVRALDAIFRAGSSDPHHTDKPEHLVTGQKGEEIAYFFLRENGYVMVAKNFRSPRYRGEIDLIGWDRDELCFVEVKTRKRRSLAPAEMAVDSPKQAMLRSTAKAYLRRMKEVPRVRFDIVSIYCDGPNDAPEITLFKNAFQMS